MTLWNRAFALAGCALIAVACTQDTSTAPPLAADVVAEGGALPSSWGTESGTFTLVKHRDFLDRCWLKVSLKGLYDDPNTTGEHYMLYAGGQQVGPIFESDMRRGTFRGEFLWSQAWGDDLLHLEYWYSGWWPVDRPIGVPNSPTTTYEDMKLVNRCY